MIQYIESKKDNIIRGIFWAIMLSALLASMRHVAWMFSTLEDGVTSAGWLAAVAFDATIFVLTLLARKHKESTKERRRCDWGVRGAAIVTVLANIVYMIEHQQELKRISGPIWFALPAIFGLALPALVVYLAEVLSSEEDSASREFRREQNKLSRKSVTQDLQVVTSSVTEDSQEDSAKVLDAVTSGVTSHRAIADMTGFDRGKVGRILKMLVTSGALKKDARGRVSLPERDTNSDTVEAVNE